MRPGLPAAGLILLLAAAALLLPRARGAAQQAPAAVWACGESLKVRPETAAPVRSSVWSAADGRVRLHGARGEYVGFQVVVRAGEAGLRGAAVRVEPLRGPAGAEIAAENVDLFRQHFLRVAVPSQFGTVEPVPEAGLGEYPVQMVPLRGSEARFDVPAGRNQPVWVDLWVPERQSPGEYAGTVRVTAGDAELAALPVQLTVWRFTLPRETHLKTLLPTGPEQLRWGFGLRRGDDRALREIEDRCFQMAHQHRLNFHVSAGEDPEEEWGGRYRGYLDGTAFRDRVGAGVGQNLMVVGVGGENAAEITAHARRVTAWWKRAGFKGELACYLYDEPQEDSEFATVAAWAGLVRAAVGRDLPLYLPTTHPEKLPPGLIDIWGEVPAAQVPARQAAGERVWAVNQGYAGGPYVDTPGPAGRSQAWMAWRMKLDGWHFWDACYWVDRQNILGADGKRLPQAAIEAAPERFLTDTWSNPLTFDQKRNPKHRDWIRLNGDGVLFYPGRPAGLPEPLSSFTMKSLRRGLQDYEYLWLLRERGRPAADVVARLVPKPHEWSRDPDAWDEARLELGRRLEALAQ